MTTTAARHIEPIACLLVLLVALSACGPADNVQHVPDSNVLVVALPAPLPPATWLVFDGLDPEADLAATNNQWSQAAAILQAIVEPMASDDLATPPDPDRAQTLYNLAVALERTGDINGARRSWSLAIQADPDFGPAIQERVRVEIRHRGPALQVASTLAHTHRHNVFARVALADANIVSGAPEHGVQLAREVLNDDPANTSARRALATAWLASKRPALAAMVASQQQNDAPELRMVRAIALADSDYRQEAQDELALLVAQRPDWIEAWERLGQLSYLAGDYQQAADALSVVVVEHPERHDIWLQLGNARRANGQGNAAETVYRRVIEEDPLSAEAHFLLGALYLADHQVAVDTFEGIARLHAAKLHLDQALGLADDADAQVIQTFADNAHTRVGSSVLLEAVADMPAELELDDEGEHVGDLIAKADHAKHKVRNHQDSDKVRPLDPNESIARLFGVEGKGDNDVSLSGWGDVLNTAGQGIGEMPEQEGRHRERKRERQKTTTVENQVSTLTTMSRAKADTQARQEPMQRYPSIEAPRTTVVGAEFAVLVSLTEEKTSDAVRILQGGDGGAVLLDLPKQDQPWILDVVMTAPGFTVRDGKNVGTLALSPEGDSSPAMFRLTAAEVEGEQAEMPIYMTFWHDGTYIARVERKVIVTRPGTVAAPDTAGSTGTPGPSPIHIAEAGHTSPDLTIFVLRLEGDAQGRERMIVINSPHLQPSQHFVAWPEEMEPWVHRQFEKFAAETPRGVRIKVNKAIKPVKQKDRNIAMMEGFGTQMWEKFSPAPVQDAIWQLHDQLGEDFESIQIITNDPTFPWELIKPVRVKDNVEEELDFLGVQFRVARWHVNGDTQRQLARPPQQHIIRELVAIAPEYTGDWALPNQQIELDALSSFTAFRHGAGDMAAVAPLLDDLPQGIVHFAGHGIQRVENGVSEYVLMFEDQEEVDLLAWRGWTPRVSNATPFFFINACELGQASSMANFVDGWAPAVLETGASGYIGGLWPLGDRGAADFAISFYGELGSHKTTKVGDALRVARKRFYETGDPTYLGYVYYGDPNLRMVLR